MAEQNRRAAEDPDLIAQQGDVLFFRAELPAHAKKVNRTVLAEGEVTGHAHRLAIEEATDAEVFEHAGVLYVLAPSGVRVIHQEHGPVDLAPGTYRVGRVQEYDHFEEEARYVRD